MGFEMGKLKTVLKKLFGTKISVKCTIDEQVYRENMKSTMGGTTAGKSLLLLAERENDFGTLVMKLSEEGFSVKCQKLYETITQEEHEQYHDIIVNLIELKNCRQEIEDLASQVYKANQQAANYFVDNNLQGHIVNIVVTQVKSEVQDIVSSMSKDLIQGLKVALGRHGITIVGLMCYEVDEKTKGWLSYLCGKYGYPLTGQTIDLRASKG